MFFRTVSFQVLCGTTILFNKEKLWRMWIGLKPIVVLFKPEAVEVRKVKKYYFTLK